jgi:hypothetical protein
VKAVHAMHLSFPSIIILEFHVVLLFYKIDMQWTYVLAVSVTKKKGPLQWRG